MHHLRRLSRGGRLLLALTIGGAVFGIASAVQADIPDSGVIHGCYGKPGTTYKGNLRVRDASQGEQCRSYENPLDWNQVGPTGVTGPTGPTGATGFVSVGGWAGGVQDIPEGTDFVFAGPVTTQTTTATQSLVASGSAALGTTEGSADVDVAVCKSPSGANTPTLLDTAPGGAYEVVEVTGTRLTYAVSEVGAPGAGTWDVGMCVENDGPATVDNNDWSIGWAFVSNGLPTSQAPTKLVGHAP